MRTQCKSTLLHRNYTLPHFFPIKEHWKWEFSVPPISTRVCCITPLLSLRPVFGISRILSKFFWMGFARSTRVISCVWVKWGMQWKRAYQKSPGEVCPSKRRYKHFPTGRPDFQPKQNDIVPLKNSYHFLTLKHLQTLLLNNSNCITSTCQGYL